MPSIPSQKTHSLKNFILLALVLLYGAIRIPLLDIQAMGFDEKRDIEIVQGNIAQERMIYHGARFSDKGHIPSPIYYNILTWGYQLTDSLLGMRWITFLFNWVGMALLIYFISSLFSIRITILYGVFIAFSPWLVKYTTFSWNPNYLPMASAGYLFAGYKTLVGEKSPWILPALLFLFFGVSMHIIVLPFILAFLVMLFVLPKKINWVYGSTALFIIACFLGVYVYYDAKNDWWNTQFLFTSKDSLPYQLEALKVLQYSLLYTTTEVSHFIKRGFNHVVEYWLPWYQAMIFVIALISSALITVVAHYLFFREQWGKIRNLGIRGYLTQNPLYGFIFINLIFFITFAIVLGRGFVSRYTLFAAYYLILIIVIEVDQFLERSRQKSKKLYRLCLIGWIGLMAYNLYLSFRVSIPHPLNHIFY